MAKNRIKIARNHLIIPDVQTKPGVPNEHLSWVGHYIAEKQPDVVIQIGDFADMASLSSYDKGKGKAEGKRYWKDIRASHEAMELLMKPIRKVKGYAPEMHLTLGNHEERINRYANDVPEMEGHVSIDNLEFERWGWNVHDFLKIIKIDGIEYTHYFTSGVKGNAVTRAVTILNTRHSSGVMGHNQATDIAFHQKSGHIAIMAGCCYLHEEDYLGPQMEGKAQRRQIVMLHEVHDNGIADPMLVSLEFLKRKYS